MARQPRILIVDDNARNVDILRKILVRDHALATAASGEEALAVAPLFLPDLVLLDIMMPGIDGYETCRQMRAHSALRWTKIVMVSAKAMVSERVSGYQAGADDYLTKPFDPDELVAKVRVHLRLKSVEEVDQLKTNFLTLLRHETRTPLTGLIGAAELLQTDVSMDDAERRDLAGVVLRSAMRLHELFDKVLTLSALRSGERTLRLEPVDAGRLVRDAVSVIGPQASEKGVRIEQAVAGPALAMLDRDLMSAVVMSLLDNAIRFSPANGTVEIAAAGDDQHLRLTVTDQGAGIDPGFLASVFDEFTTPDIAAHSSGHGLSLAIARQIVRGHDGDISVESGPARGTVFRLAVPRGIGESAVRAFERPQHAGAP